MLWPPINHINKTFLTEYNEDNFRDYLHKENDSDVYETIKMPNFIADKIKRRQAVKKTLTETTLKLGQIRLIKTEVTEQPISFLLNKLNNQKIWEGWIVSSETDYATIHDILLETDIDEPFDPLAGTIQTWNVVRLHEMQLGQLLANLTAERLRTINSFYETMSTHSLQSPFESDPSRMVGWKWDENQPEILVGTPLGDNRFLDSRYAYQKQYKQYADEILVTANKISAKEIAKESKQNVIIKKQIFKKFPIQSLAAGLVIGIIGSFIFLNQPEDPFIERSVNLEPPLMSQYFNHPDEELLHIKNLFIEKGKLDDAIEALRYFQGRYPDYGKLPLNKDLTKNERIEMAEKLIKQKDVEQAIYVLYSILQIDEED